MFSTTKATSSIDACTNVFGHKRLLPSHLLDLIIYIQTIQNSKYI